MNSILFSENLFFWMLQVSVIASVGVLLPMLFRIRHPKTQLAYYQAVLLICMVLPLIEPWQHPFVFVSGGQAAAKASTMTWPALLKIAEWIVAVGAVAKLCWIAAGIRQVRKVREAALPLFPIPESIRNARTLTCSDAVFRISRGVTGPATLGHVDPVILLPESFSSMDQDAQLSIACHELLHVKRHDWLVMVAEEIAGALFWFNPAVRLLLSQTRLSREQLVDREVVGLTAARTPYVEALLSMAVPMKGLRSVPSASFFTEGHLAHRVRSLLTERKCPVSRLLASYASIACLLTLVGWGATLFFPLKSDAQVVEPSVRVLQPRMLYAWQWHSFSKPSPVFEVRVPPPSGAAETVQGSVSEVPSSPSAGGSDVSLSLTAPPPRIGLFRILEPKGIRMVGLGEKPTAEEMARMQAGLGENRVLQIVQSSDGTVQKITIIGRGILDRYADQTNDETNTFSRDVIFGTGGPSPAVFTDRIH